MRQTRLVYIADREADMATLMARAQALGTPADWLIRAQHNRCGKFWAATRSQAPLGEIEFTLASRQRQAERTARQRLWEHGVDLPATAGDRARDLRDCQRNRYTRRYQAHRLALGHQSQGADA